jgi:universal stress protein E
MNDIRRILVAIAEPNARAQPGLEKATQLARRTGAEIDLFHCLYNPYVQSQRIYGRRGLSADIEMLVQATRERLEQRAKPVAESGIRIRTSVRWDYPAHEGIVRQAVRHKADLVVATTQRYRAAQRWFLSNTDWQLIRECPMPLLLVKSPRAWTSSTVLAAIDPLHAHAKPAALDAEILRFGSILSDALESSLHVAHAYPPAMTVVPGMMAEALPVAVTGPEARRYARRVRRAVTTLCRRHGVSDRRLHVTTGDAKALIPELARQLGTQLVVMGAVSRSGLKRLFIGNTAERIIDRLDCDICVIKPPGFRTPVAAQPHRLPMLFPAV